MAGFLFDDIVFGPVISRRLGVSLGINLLPANRKFCTFDCVYCECGWTEKKPGDAQTAMPSFEQVIQRLNQVFADLKADGTEPDNITFAGNGEPTIHPQFPEIIDHIIELRNSIFPKAKISVLSNATKAHLPKIKEALLKVDNNILKLDAGTEEMFKRINGRVCTINFEKLLESLESYQGNLIIQTLFLRGEAKGERIDNTSEEELALWTQHIQRIQPKYVMIYPTDRETPAENLEKIGKQELQDIALRIEQLGIKTEVY